MQLSYAGCEGTSPLMYYSEYTHLEILPIFNLFSCVWWHGTLASGEGVGLETPRFDSCPLCTVLLGNNLVQVAYAMRLCHQAKAGVLTGTV